MLLLEKLLFSCMLFNLSELVLLLSCSTTLTDLEFSLRNEELLLLVVVEVATVTEVLLLILL